MLDARLFSSAKYKSLFERFGCEVVDNKLIYHRRDPDDILQERQEVKIYGLFNFSKENNVDKFMAKYYDRFNFDDLIKHFQTNPICKLYIKDLKRSCEKLAKEFENMTDEELARAPGVDREGHAKYFRTRPFNITRDSSNEDKIEFVFHFTAFNVTKSVELDGKPCLECAFYPQLMTFNEQILNICNFDDFEIDEEFCEWDIDNDDVLILNFKYKGE